MSQHSKKNIYYPTRQRSILDQSLLSKVLMMMNLRNDETYYLFRQYSSLRVIPSRVWRIQKKNLVGVSIKLLRKNFKMRCRRSRVAVYIITSV